MRNIHLPVTPGAILGYRKNGAPIRVQAGAEDPPNPAPPAPADPAAPPATPAADPPQPPADPPASGQEPPAPATGDDTPRVIAALRDDFKGERAKRQEAERQFAAFKAESERKETERQAAETERNKKLAIALGVASEDEPPDPAKLAEQLERAGTEHTAALAAKDTEIRQRDIRLAVLTQAPALGANGALLMDSLSFITRLSGLDPGAGDFTERLGEEIRTAADANPQYKITAPPAGDPQKPAPAVPRSGGEHNGAPGGNRQLTLADVDRMTPAEVVKAQEDGLLIDLGFSPRKKRF